MKKLLQGTGVSGAALAVLVPFAKCPICAAAAAGVIGSLGVASLGLHPWFVPVLAILLLVGLWGFFQTGRQHRKWQWFALAVAASALALGGRVLDLPALVWSGALSLVVVYVFDLRAKREMLSARKTGNF